MERAPQPAMKDGNEGYFPGIYATGIRTHSGTFRTVCDDCKILINRISRMTKPSKIKCNGLKMDISD